MSSQTPVTLSTPDLQALIESVAGENEKARTLLQGLYDRITALSPPTVALTGSQVPAQSALSVAGVNGSYAISVTNAAQGASSLPLYHRISYSTVQNFGQNVTTLPASTATTYNVASPGSNAFFKLESSFDGVHWNTPVLTTGGPVAAKLQSSAAQENGTVLNQSNYLYVDSQQDADIGAANVRVYGAAGPYNGGITDKGGTESVAPSATIVNVPLSTNQFVAYDGEQYRLTPQLPGIFDDSNTPIGKVSVVGAGAVTLPAVTLIVNAGHIVSYNITNYGEGLTELPTFNITDVSGTGGKIQATGLNSGAITGIQILNGGENYSSTPAVTAEGGVFSGATGGGTVAGGNGGRLTNV